MLPARDFMSVTLSEVVAVVLAGGTGTRVQHLLGGLPKPMAPVKGRPFLEWLVRYLAKQGIKRVVISTGYRAEVVAAHFDPQPVPGVKTSCVAETAPLGTAGGVLHAVRQSNLKPPAWLVLNGDTLCFANLNLAAMELGDPEVSGVIYAREVPDASRYGSLVMDTSGCLAEFVEKRPGKGLISTGVYLLRDELVQAFPDRVPLSLERDVFPELTARQVLLKVEPMSTPFLDIGTPESLPQAGDFIRRNREQFALA
jgi:D-glycero-alpha-D-manno-heptose 1-phosphate guanylyltransferase